MAQIWLASTKFASSVYLWRTVLSGACCKLFPWWFPSIHQNELRDITAELLTEVCHNVGTEPPLQPITDEHLIHRTANREDGAQLDVAADNFWEGAINNVHCLT